MSILVVGFMATSTGVLAGDPETRLRAPLTAAAAAGDISGKCDFRTRGNRRKFSAEAEGFAAGDALDVVVDGDKVGTITIGELGEGGIDFDDRQPNDEPPFPANFPQVGAGVTCAVGGDLSGTFQAK